MDRLKAFLNNCSSWGSLGQEQYDNPSMRACSFDFWAVMVMCHPIPELTVNFAKRKIEVLAQLDSILYLSFILNMKAQVEMTSLH